MRQLFERRFFASGESIPLWDDTVFGLALNQAAFEKLTHDNFLRFAGERPRPIDRKAAAAYLERRLKDARYRLTDRERTIIRNIQKECLRQGIVSDIL